MKRRLFISMMLAASLFAVLPATVSADQYVSPGDDIQAVVDFAAANGGTVHFAAGTYYVNIVIDTPSQSFTLRGSGEGVTFLDGGGTGTVISISETSDRVVIIEGFTIQNGHALMGGPIYANGGGMFNCGANPVVRNCSFVSNHADNHGGGMFNGNGSQPHVENCSFIDNTAGINLWYGDWSDYNNWHWSDSGHGAGMANNGMSAPTVISCLFSGNNASYSGGGMKNGGFSPGEILELDSQGAEGSPIGVCGETESSNVCEKMTLAGEPLDGDVLAVPTIINCTFVGNTAGWSGGGMTNAEYSMPNIQNCLFEGNISMWNAGGMKNSLDSKAKIDGCVFSNNKTGWNGGGMKNGYSSSPMVTNCVFVGNEVVGLNHYSNNSVIISGGGGGMKNGEYAAPTVTNCTFYGNSVTYTSHCGDNDGANGGGVKNGNYTQAVYTNCIIWGNTPNNVLDSTYDNPQANADTTITYSNVGGGYLGEGNIDADPLFVNAPADVSLRSTSPCIDAGTDTSAEEYGYVTDDILGVRRPQRSAHDMGAYELAGVPFSPVIIQPLARTQLASVLSLWEEIQGMLPDEPTDGAAALIAQVQGHVANAAQLTNPIYASGQLSKAAKAMQQLAALLV